MAVLVAVLRSLDACICVLVQYFCNGLFAILSARMRFLRPSGIAVGREACTRSDLRLFVTYSQIRDIGALLAW